MKLVLGPLVLALLASVACAKEIRIPLPPTPCTIPAFHVQASCEKPDGHDDLPCLLTEFAATVQAEKQVADALKTCPEVHVVR